MSDPNFGVTYEHVARVSAAVHDELIRWTGGLLKQAGLEAVDVWGRFPPEGTVRSHLVLFPYRVGPEPKMLENAPGSSIVTRDPTSAKQILIPKPWLDLGRLLVVGMEKFFPEAGLIDSPRRPNTSPYPRVDALPDALRDWYASRVGEEQAWVVEDLGENYARPPAVQWRPGITVMAHYLAVAGDAGRGVQDRTSEAPPLSLSALSVLTVGIQLERLIRVELPPMPFDPRLISYGEALAQGLRGLSEDEDAQAAADELTTVLKTLQSPALYRFDITPVHDLSMQEFALLTQALQRPLQAVLNFRMVFNFGDRPELAPTATVSVRRPARQAERR